MRWIERGRPAVLALGGGAFAQPANRAVARKQRHHRLAGLPVRNSCSAAWRRPRTGRWRAIPRAFAALYHARRDRLRPGRRAHPDRERRSRRSRSTPSSRTPYSNEHDQDCCAGRPPPSSARRWRRPIRPAPWSATWRAATIRRFRNIYVIGAGKAGASMARAAERVLGKRITAGLINVKDGHLAKLRRIELNECGHPVPDERGVAGAERIARIAAVGRPRRPGGLPDLRRRLGAAAAARRRPSRSKRSRPPRACCWPAAPTIHEINAVRKHISRIKGGQLARLAAPATVEALLLSDVIGDDLDVIGSGPTAPDASTFATAARAFSKSTTFASACPRPCASASSSGMRGEIPETPKPADPLFARVRNTVVGSNRLALDAAARAARELGLPHAGALQRRSRARLARSRACTPPSPARSRAPDAPCGRRPASSPGGETTVTIKGDGLGGRNQEFVLAAAIDIAGLDRRRRLQRGHRRHRRSHRCRRRDRRWRHAAPQAGRARNIWSATIRTTTSSRSATW